MREFIVKNRDYLLVLFGFILGALFLIFDIKCLNAEEITYYDWEQVEVSTLPEASSSTMNKVYINNSKYYITNEVVTGAGNPRPLQVGDDLCSGYVIIEDFTTQELIDWYESYHGDVYNPKIMYNHASFDNSFLLITGSHIFKFYGLILMYNDVKISSISFPYTMDFSNHQVCTSSAVPDTVQYIHPDWNLTFIKYVSNSSVATYSWQEVSEDLVIPFDRHLSDDDFYLFYSFEDISNFNILSNYDFTNFSDFEKLMVVIGFNLIFIIFLFGVVYIFIKLLNKGISFIFK